MRRILLPLALAASLCFAACIEWTTDSQGNLRSFGVPGVPVWTAQSTPPSTAVHQPVLELDQQSVELIGDSAASGDWIVELNRWRELAGENPVAENSQLNAGSEAHARYLVMQGPKHNADFNRYAVHLGAGKHTENPNSPSYTAEGAEAAQGGKLVPGVMQSADVAYGDVNEISDVDRLIIGPFHRLSLLAPWAQVGGYGSFGEYPRRAAALALRGKSLNEYRAPIEFPPSDSSIAIRSMTFNEWPDPLESCPEYRLPVGLPITVQLGRRVELVSHSVRDDTARKYIETCTFDATTYRSRDASVQQWARQLLKQYGAIVLVPRHPLMTGHHYHVIVETRLHRISWAFHITPSNAQQTSAERRDIRQN